MAWRREGFYTHGEGISYPALTHIGGQLRSGTEPMHFPALVSLGQGLFKTAPPKSRLESFPVLSTIRGRPFDEITNNFVDG